MKRNYLVLFLILIFPIWGHSQSFDQFNFEYKFLKNIYISKANMFTKDMVADPSVTFEIKFTRKERKLVFDKLQEINFWNYPEVYDYESADSTFTGLGYMQPCFGYSMTVYSKNYNKKVSWTDCRTANGSKGRLYEKLMELNELIYKIISAKEAFKNSPPLRSGYL